MNAILVNLSACLRDRGGNIGMMFSAAAFAIAGFVGVGIDYANASRVRVKMQSAADQATLAGARVLRLGNANATSVAQVAQNSASQLMSSISGLPASPTITPAVSSDLTNVSITINATVPTYLAQTIGAQFSNITVTSRARVLGGAPLCLLTTDPTASIGLSVKLASNISAPACSVYSNSTSMSSITVADSSVVTAASACAGGGVVGTSSNLSPMPKSDCPNIPDPMLGLAPPSVSTTCDYTNTKILGKTVTINPGVYCGGLNIDLFAKVTMNPGVYIMKDGPFNVVLAQVTGKNVGIYLTGANTRPDLVLGSTVDLEAPVTGSMAGVLVWEDKSTTTPNLTHIIYSSNVHNLLGTIYLPNGYLAIGSPNAVADQSAYTIIIAKQVSLVASPKLLLNANYGATTVPTPPGLGPITSGVFLDM